MSLEPTADKKVSSDPNMSVITLNQRGFPLQNSMESNSYTVSSSELSNYITNDNDGYSQLDLDSILGIGNISLQDKTNLIVNYLPQNVDDSLLKALFVEYGQIESAKVVKDKRTKKSSGFGFVKFVNPLDAANAIQNKNGFAIGNKRLKVSYARPQSDDIKDCKLYITNLPKEFDEVDVRKLFGQFGKIIECRVIKHTHANFHNKGVSFIQFDLRSQAEKALALDGVCLPGQSRKLTVKFTDNYKRQVDPEQQIFDHTINHSVSRPTSATYPSGYIQDNNEIRMRLTSSPESALSRNSNISDFPNGYNYNYGVDSSNHLRSMSTDVDDSSVSNSINYSIGNNVSQSSSPTEMSYLIQNINQMKMNRIQSTQLGANVLSNYPVQQKNRYESGLNGSSLSSKLSNNTLTTMPSMSSSNSSHSTLTSTSSHSTLPSPTPMSTLSSNMNSNFGFSSSNTSNYSSNTTASYSKTQSSISIIEDTFERSAGNNSNNNGMTGTLLITNLPSDANIGLLYQIFGNYGKIISAMVELDPNQLHNGQPLCKGKVQMLSVQEASNALVLNGCRVGNLPIQVSMYSISPSTTILGNNNQFF